MAAVIPVQRQSMRGLLSYYVYASHCYGVRGKMATSILRLPLRFSSRNTGIMTRNTTLKTSTTSRTTQSRTVVSTSSGAILPKPEKTPFGLIRMTVVVVPFLYVGTLISKNFAALLEEHDIFVPEDDDDDD